MTVESRAHLPPPPRRPLPRILARRWLAWGVSVAVVVVTEILIWNGWNASGRWIPVTGWMAVYSYAFHGAWTAVPVVLALLILRRWPSLVVVLVVVLASGVQAAQALETSTSSTAVFYRFGPLVYGVPSVIVVCVAENVITWLARRPTTPAQQVRS